MPNSGCTEPRNLATHCAGAEALCVLKSGELNACLQIGRVPRGRERRAGPLESGSYWRGGEVEMPGYPYSHRRAGRATALGPQSTCAAAMDLTCAKHVYMFRTCQR